MAVAAVLAQEGDGVEQHHVGLLRPGQPGVGGEEGPALGSALLGGLAGQVGGLGQPGVVDEVAQHRAQALVGPVGAGVEHLLGRGRLPRRGRAARTSAGWKLKNVASTTSEPTAPMAAAREAK